MAESPLLGPNLWNARRERATFRHFIQEIPTRAGPKRRGISGRGGADETDLLLSVDVDDASGGTNQRRQSGRRGGERQKSVREKDCFCLSEGF